MGGARAVSDAVVPHLVTNRLQGTSGKMKALLSQRQNSSYGGAEEIYHIFEDRAVYAEFQDAVSRVQLISEKLALEI